MRSLLSDFLNLPLPMLMLLSLGLVFAVAFPIASFFTHHRERGFREIAQRYGATYHKQSDPRVVDISTHLTLSLLDLKKDFHPYISHLLRQDEQSWTRWVFDYVYTGEDYFADTTTRTSPQQRTVVLYESQNMHMPVFRLETRRNFAGIDPSYPAFRNAYTSMNIPVDQAFSEKFYLRGQNTKEVQAFFDGPLRQFFLHLDATPFVVEGAGKWIAIYTNKDGALALSDIPQFIADAERVYGMLAERNRGR